MKQNFMEWFLIVLTAVFLSIIIFGIYNTTYSIYHPYRIDLSVKQYKIIDWNIRGSQLYLKAYNKYYGAETNIIVHHEPSSESIFEMLYLQLSKLKSDICATGENGEWMNYFVDSYYAEHSWHINDWEINKNDNIVVMDSTVWLQHDKNEAHGIFNLTLVYKLENNKLLLLERVYRRSLHKFLIFYI
ncbi:MAG: hypothetical protein PHP92_03595 [Candidatus Nanoarchaeia archaeon]|nr:hypothetical protein [Candidatus Nanoarchaeia archaeon]